MARSLECLRIRDLAFAIILSTILPTLSCTRSFPDAYGFYADTNHGRLLLQSHGVQRVGNMMSYFAGLNSPQGPECSSVKDFIVYEKDVNPNSVQLVRLSFLKEGRVSGFLNTTPVRVNLWVPENKNIEFDVKPVEDHRDMYIIVPRAPLDRGFYALYTGQFGGDVGSRNNVYDFVVGHASDFPSYAAAVKSRDSEVRENGAALLAKFNESLNHSDYQHLQDVYRPGGNILSGTELQEFTTGNQTWLSNAGQILKSEITAVSLIGDNGARCTVKTTYQKLGTQEETMTITKIGDQYFLTDIK